MSPEPREETYVTTGITTVYMSVPENPDYQEQKWIAVWITKGTNTRMHLITPVPAEDVLEGLIQFEGLDFS